MYFSDGLAQVHVGKRDGYIDESGNIVIEPQFETSSPFLEGVAAVRRDGKIGYIDRSGKTLGTLQFDSAAPFSEEMGLVYLNELAGFVNKSGQIVINPQFYYAESFQDGLALVWATEYGPYGLIDTVGKFVTAFDHPTFLYSEGLAAFVDTTTRKSGYVNSAGEVVISAEYDEVNAFSGGRAMVFKDGSVSYIDPIGKPVISVQYQDSHNDRRFREGFAIVQIYDQVGFIDDIGNIVIEPRFDGAYPFWHGVALVYEREGPTTSYIDRYGNYIWPAK